MQETNAVHQVLVKLLDGKHRTLNFSSQSVSVQTLKQKIQTLTLIPAPLQLLLSSNSRCALQDHQTLDFETGSQQKPVTENKSGNESGYFPVVIHVLLRLRGGKGGFGSLLRGAATKAGQKKTNNFDACRDMSGRRLRHVNAEKKLEEWKAESGERRLEKMAEDYIKNKAKEMAKKGSGSRSKNGESTEKYVAKYKEDSAKYVELIEKSVKESLKGCLSSKRKASDLNKSDAKKLKIWKGKRILDNSDSDSEDSGDSDDDKDTEDTIAVVIDNGSRSESSVEPNRSGKSAMCGKFDLARSEEDEKVNIVQDCSEVCITSTKGQTAEDYGEKETRLTPEHGCTSSPEEMLKKSDNEVSCNPDLVLANEVVGQPTILSTFVQNASDNSVSKPAVKEVEISATAPDKNLIMPLSFDEINSSAELEVLGMDRLKAELQARGLKCGGTLQERATRLFLLKTTPLDMLPKKYFCKK